MSELSDLLAIQEFVDIWEDEFSSAHGADYGAARQVLEEQINQRGVVDQNRLIEAAGPTPSTIREYTLGCGVPILLAVSKEAGDITSAYEIFFEPKAFMIDSVPGREPDFADGRLIDLKDGSTKWKEYMDRLLRRDPWWVPLREKKPGRFEIENLRGYQLANVSGTSTVAAARCEETSGIQKYSYAATVDRSRPGQAQTFQMAYEVFPNQNVKTPEASSYVKIDYDAQQEDFVKEATLATGGMELTFNDEGELSGIHIKRHYMDYLGDDFYVDTDRLRSHERVSLSQIAAMAMLDCSPGERLSYADSIRNLVSAANGASAEQPVYSSEALLRCEPFVFYTPG